MNNHQNDCLCDECEDLQFLQQTLIFELQEYAAEHQNVTLKMSPSVAFSLIATLQLALRHPENNGESADSMRRLADVLTKTLTNNGERKAITKVIKMGWNPAFDGKNDGQDEALFDNKLKCAACNEEKPDAAFCFDYIICHACCVQCQPPKTI